MARVAAPLAFLLAATIAVLLVRSALNSEPAATPATTAETQTFPVLTTDTTETQTETAPQGEFYVVQAGDTLGSIAAEHGTTVEALLELNPEVDPVALRIGQRIRVS